MYAPASPFSRPIPAGARSLSSVYRQVGVETSVGGATPHELVTLLYNGLFDTLAQARGAIRAKDVGAKAKALSRAVRIVDEGLKASLNRESGGELAVNLNNLYGYVCLRLTHANLHSDEAAIDECIHLMTPLRDAWVAIGTPSTPETRKPLEVQA